MCVAVAVTRINRGKNEIQLFRIGVGDDAVDATADHFEQTLVQAMKSLYATAGQAWVVPPPGEIPKEPENRPTGQTAGPQKAIISITIERLGGDLQVSLTTFGGAGVQKQMDSVTMLATAWIKEMEGAK